MRHAYRYAPGVQPTMLRKLSANGVRDITEMPATTSNDHSYPGRSYIATRATLHQASEELKARLR